EKTVLGLACGTGTYSRIAVELGAKNVIGISSVFNNCSVRVSGSIVGGE
ncbi:8985_t:CDS:2, partial [Gigaspora rosea]